MTHETWDDATLMAYADGELDEPARTALEAAAGRDAELAARLAGHRELREKLQRAYDPVLAEAVPERLLAVLGATAERPAEVISLTKRRAAAAPVVPAAPAPRRWSWPEWTAMAASLAIGVFATLFLAQPGPMGVRNGALVAQGELAAALSAQLASTQTGTEPTQIGLSFRNRSGQYCRTFQLQTTAGLACREQSEWRLEAVSAAAALPSGETFRTAAAMLPPALLAVVEETIDGDALDADDERVARDEGWQRDRDR